MTAGNENASDGRAGTAARPRLSYAQARIWLLNQMTGPDPQYNVPLVLRCRHEVDADALRAAFLDVLLRHEILRTSYRLVEGRAVQDVLPAAMLGGVLSVERQTESSLAARIAELSAHGFALDAEAPLRAWLISTDSTDSTDSAGDVLVIVIHHIAVDGASLRPLLRDLGTAYAARLSRTEPAWQPLPLHYTDYASWQQELLGEKDDPESLSARQLAHWCEKLARLPVETPLPVDRQRSSAAVNFDAKSVPVLFSAESHRLVENLARAERVVPSTVFKAAVAAFLSRVGAGDDIPLAGFVSGRADAALDDLVGFFVNTVVYRVDTSGDPTFRDLVRRVRVVEFDAYANQDVPFDEVVRALKPPRSSKRHPLAQVAVSYEYPVAYEIPALDVDVEPGDNLRAKFDLSLRIEPRSDSSGAPAGIFMNWRYAAALFETRTVEVLVAQFAGFFEAALRDADQRVRKVAEDVFDR
ncbi:condensation domain-containing protein [Lentzea sp. JNUCC 0626]|uniref:condensation domain-containing protein n=1 Tax=Lentzea sp. JNUCC 0626 TaxID=3367513 RepID=UPI003747FCA6